MLFRSVTSNSNVSAKIKPKNNKNNVEYDTDIRSNGRMSRRSVELLGIRHIQKDIISDVDEITELEHLKNKKVISLGDIVKEISDIKIKYDTDLNYLLDELNSGEKDKQDIMDELLRFYRDQNINSHMVSNKLIFYIFCIGMEVFAVRILKLENLRGICKYMANKMPNFIEFMHFMAAEKVDEAENVEKDASFHYDKITRALCLEVIVFVTASLCSDGTFMKSDMLDRISDITINDTKGNPVDNMPGYLASIVSNAIIGNSTGDSSPDSHL